MSYAEANYENAVIEIFRDSLGYDDRYAPNVEREYNEPLYIDELKRSLQRINPSLPSTALEETLDKIRRIDGSTIQKNRLFTDYLQNGVSVNFYHNKERERRSALVRLIDYDQVERNSFIVANQSFILYTMFALKQQLDMFNGEGTVFGSINKNAKAALSVVIPTDEVVQQFENIVNPMDTTIRNNFNEICHLQAARDTLLPRLMSGELSVANLDDAKL